MKLEIGMYARYGIYGNNQIGKIKTISDNVILVGFGNTGGSAITFRGLIKKASFNIIDLIEVGDYVNGSEVLDFENKYIEEDDKFVPIGVVTENCYLENTDSWILEKDIKTIVTKEQFENMKYRIGDE